MNGIIITDENASNRFETAEKLETLIEQTDEKNPDLNLDGLQIHTGSENPCWEKGEPCPDCGSTAIHGIDPELNLYISDDGEFDFQEMDQVTNVNLGYQCASCNTKFNGLPLETIER